MSKRWPVQDAKSRFSELLDTTIAEGPQIVTKRGVETAVLLPIEHWRRLERMTSITAALIKGKAWKCVSCNEISRPWPDASVATVTTIQPDQRSHGAARAACITTASPRALSGV